VWQGFCNTHDKLTKNDVIKVREKHPGALVLAHPECRPDVVDMADVVASTSGMLKYAAESSHREFIVCTELGIMHQFEKRCPGKRFYPVINTLICPNMKATTLEKVHRALVTLEPRITVPADIREKALKSLERMLEVK